MSDGDLQLIPTAPDLPRPLGRSVLWHDPRNRQHRALDVLPQRASGRALWWARHVFDQQGSSCTMQAAAGCVHTSPNRLHVPRSVLAAWDTEQERHAGYIRAQRLDPWPGGEDHYPRYEGSSTDAPFRLLRDLGHIKGWAWCFGVREIITTLQTRGPVSVGSKWYRQMFDPRRRGDLRHVRRPAGLPHDPRPDRRGPPSPAGPVADRAGRWQLSTLRGRWHGGYQHDRVWAAVHAR